MKSLDRLELVQRIGGTFWLPEHSGVSAAVGFWAVVSSGVRDRVADEVRDPGIYRTRQAVAASAKEKLR